MAGQKIETEKISDVYPAGLNPLEFSSQWSAIKLAIIRD